jgi:hypothetical protein
VVDIVELTLVFTFKLIPRLNIGIGNVTVIRC